MDKVKIVRSLKRKTLTIQINSDATITVSAPYFVTSTSIKNFLKEKDSWIQQKLQELQTRKNITKPKEFTKGEEFLFLGKKYQLEIRQNTTSIVELSDKLYIASFNKNNIKLYLTSWYKQQALKIIKQRVEYFAKRAGVTYNNLKITEAETRWGSCSSEKNLNFNWRLVMAPLPVIDYVVSHELAHLEEMNHSRQFWERVRKIFPIYRQYNTWLKRNGHTLKI
jgi:predicted metal-dependent hydrolase